ncbi:MAG: E3 binding domain-containing protein, partial [Xanthobacteraceae bacterium]|nr:E3 binding domain-containing protein [Xanthobacteraceae bacterium]
MDILMPQLGETVAEGKITTWFKAIGDPVQPGDNLFEIETDKVTMEVPATSAGTLTEIRVAAGEVAPVGAVVAIVAGATGEAPLSPPLAGESWRGGKREAADPDGRGGGTGGATNASAVGGTGAASPSPPSPASGGGSDAARAAPSSASPALPAGAAGKTRLSPPLAGESWRGGRGGATNTGAVGGTGAASHSPASRGESGAAASIMLDPFREVRTPERNWGAARLATGAAVTPLARRLAGQAGIDLTRIVASGPHGRIVAVDVEKAIASSGAATSSAALGPALSADRIKALYPEGTYEEVPLDAMRRTIATRLVEAVQTIPHFHLSADVVIERLEAVRKEA